jgi:undecaprenyl diphosphate synthase
VLGSFFDLLRKEQKELSLDEIKQKIDPERIPLHIAIIMDGNGRWATKKGLPRAMGHRAGVESLREAVKVCQQLKVGYLTVYAFSTENWKRPKDEVSILMNLLVEYLTKELQELHNNNVKVNAIGLLRQLPDRAFAELEKARELTKNNTGLVLNLALNYGGRAEIVEAVKKLTQDVLDNRLGTAEINEEVFASYLYTAGMPDPDLMIRPSGELRISNYLLWQLAYTEFWITPVLWPDFRPIHIIKAIYDYQNRQRRFGGLKI